MITDEDLVPFEFSDFFDDEPDADAVPVRTALILITSNAISIASRTMAMILGIGWRRI